MGETPTGPIFVPIEPDALINIEQAAVICHCTVKYIYNLRSDRLFAQQANEGDKPLFRRADVEWWLLNGGRKGAKQRKQQQQRKGNGNGKRSARHA